MKCPNCSVENSDTSRFCSNCASRLSREGPGPESLTKTLATPATTARVVSNVPERGHLLAGKYQMIGPVGKGGMGVVYRAKDLRLDRDVALKFLPPGLMEDAEARERFVREARAAAALSHPHICTVYEINEAETEPYIAMEFIGGRSLRQRMAEKRLTLNEATELAIQLAEGLEEAHKKGIVHRDIKPGNIMLTEKGEAKITDFGLAKVLGGSLITKQATAMGTVAYMSPEQAQGLAVDHRTDLWSLGVVIFEMLSGDLPFPGEREASILYSVVHEEPRPLRDEEPPIPRELELIVGRALNKDAGSRYQSAAEILKDLRRYQELVRAAEAGVFNWRSFSRRIRRPMVAIPGAFGLVALGLAVGLFFSRQAKARWARNVLLPQIAMQLEIGTWNRAEAGGLALEAEKYLPHEPKLVEYLKKSTISTTIRTEPPGAKIFMRDYTKPEAEWIPLGASPLENVRLPAGFFIWRMEKEGYETLLAASPTFDLGSIWAVLYSPYAIVRKLDKKGTLPAGMVRVTGGPPLQQYFNNFENALPGAEALKDFFIDQYEVTNRQYKEFVDQGGYRKKEYWKERFIKDGKEIPWDKALEEFVDAMGRPGPSTWQAGDYPEGQGDYPVSGVSWYEAAAYAEFAGKKLPTTSHWGIARGAHTPLIKCGNYLDFIAPGSNFSGQGPRPVGGGSGMTAFGAFDMAGNVREWCLNEAPFGRIIRGGGWKDTPYMFAYWSQAPPFDRSPENGFRCIVNDSAEKVPNEVLGPAQIAQPEDFSGLKPVSDEIFEVYKDQFFYDKLPLNAKIESRNEGEEDWIQEKITFDAAYDNERMAAHLFLPRTGAPPYQTLVHMSGAAEYQRTFDARQLWDFDYCLSFILKSGRAVLVPVWKGSFERGNDATTSIIDGDPSTQQSTDILIKIIKDFRRSIDLIETRPDLDRQKIAYGGFSFGGVWGPVLMAVDDRIKAGILQSGGIFPGTRPQLFSVNYLPRVKAPILMLSGRYDLVLPYETNTRVMFRLLPWPSDQKVFDCAHIIPRNDLIRETLAWLDRYLGPVR